MCGRFHSDGYKWMTSEGRAVVLLHWPRTYIHVYINKRPYLWDYIVDIYMINDLSQHSNMEWPWNLLLITSKINHKILWFSFIVVFPPKLSFKTGPSITRWSDIQIYRQVQTLMFYHLKYKLTLCYLLYLHQKSAVDRQVRVTARSDSTDLHTAPE